MIKNIINEFRISIIATVSFALLLCGIYPAVVWLISQGMFYGKANGSLVSVKGHVVGSSLLTQRFDGPDYFHPRPSAAGDGYDAANSGGSNLGPTSQKLMDKVKECINAYRTENNLASGVLIPVDAVTASASVLDPDISVGNALLQADRVAKSRGLTKKALLELIYSHTEGRDLWILGEPRVNVLMLNLDLDERR